MTAPVTVEGQVWIDGQALFPPIRLQLSAGRWTALLGPSGVGKSTLLRLIAGLPIGGVFEGRVDNRQPVALMAQDPGLLRWLTVRQNAALGARLRGERADAARLDAILHRTDLSNHADKLPAALSGGQRQRVALARTLMEDRPVVLLDEPFAALDARTRMAMQDLAAGVLAGRSVLMVTHDPAEAARLADLIYLLTEEGLTEHAVPATSPPRQPADPGAFACQAALLAWMIEGAPG